MVSKSLCSNSELLGEKPAEYTPYTFPSLWKTLESTLGPKYAVLLFGISPCWMSRMGPRLACKLSSGIRDRGTGRVA